jgi:hypothetical protein
MKKTAKTIKAFAYLRISSASNIGEDKDSGRRQQQAIEGFENARASSWSAPIMMRP